MIHIEFAYFCKGIYVNCKGIPNQDTFVMEIFKAAGSTYSFNVLSSYSASNYPTKLFNGGKKLSGKHRQSFPSPIDKVSLAQYFENHIKKESARNVMNYFTIPTDAGINITALAKALADQFQLIIHEPDNNTDIVASNYQGYLTAPNEDALSPFKPLYAGDNYWLETPPAQRRYSVDFYERFNHTWMIMNTGKVKWSGRKLVCVNKNDIFPYADVSEIGIPDTDPNGSAIVTVEFDARGMENTFTSKWIMVDADGRECFPGRSTAFGITIDVVNKSFNRAGGNRIG